MVQILAKTGRFSFFVYNLAKMYTKRQFFLCFPYRISKGRADDAARPLKNGIMR